MRPRLVVLFAAAIAVASALGCADDTFEPPIPSGPTGGTPTTGIGGAGGSTGGGAGDTTSSTEGGAGGATKPLPTFTTVFTILLENHDYNEIVGSPYAPYLNSLIQEHGLAVHYYDSGVHPSLPNYLYLISGAPQYPGVVNVDPTFAPYFPSNADNLAAQMEQAGIPWRAYQEHMGTPCKLTGAGLYAPKHNPFVYFANIVSGPDALCEKRDVDYTEFAADLATGAYRYMWITPDLVSDGHDPSWAPVAGLKNSDKWMAAEVPKILASEAYQSGGVLFITWDEAEGRNGNDLHQIPMIVVSPKIKAKGLRVTRHLTHASYLATLEDLFGLPRLGDAVGAPTLFEFFGD
ncbi:MAG: alkaline phosphatase family protein [Polyangiaceae bacterium]